MTFKIQQLHFHHLLFHVMAPSTETVSLTSSVPAASNSASLQPNDIGISSASGGSFGGTKRFTSSAATVESDDFGQIFSFSGAVGFNEFKSTYAELLVDKVTFHITALSALSLDSSPWIFTFGIVPRGIAQHTASTVALPTGGQISFLQDFIVSSTVHNTSCVTYAANPVGNELPFPPGIQLDLNAVEVRFRYPQPAIFHLTRKPPNSKGETTPLVHWRVEFEVTGRGRGFGSSYVV